jgi:hypothetical protein
MIAPFWRFSSLALARFLEKREITDCPKTQRSPFKNQSGSRSRSQRETLFKGFGMLPDKQNLRLTASPGTVVLSVCIYKRSHRLPKIPGGQAHP